MMSDWLRRLFQQKSVASTPDGWTEDMSVQLPSGRTVEELVEFVVAANQAGRECRSLIATVADEFLLSTEDAELAVDRVSGGMVRAALGNRANCPNRAKDPIAWTSYQRAIARRQG